MAQRPATLSRYAVSIVVGLLVLAVALRFYRIGARPIHWDEGVHGYYSWQLLTQGEFQYEPWRHGPFLYFLSAIFMWAFGESVTVGRAMVALISLGMFLALFLLREDVPTPALLFTAGILAVHPYVVSTARFYRNDALFVTFMLLVIGFYARYRRTVKKEHAIGLGASVALAIVTKEMVYFLLPGMLLVILATVHFDARFTDRPFTDVLLEYFPAKHLTTAVTVGAAILLFLYANWPPNPLGSASELLRGIGYWVNETESGNRYALYYYYQVVVETPVMFTLAVVGCLGTVVRPRSSWIRWVFFAWAALAGLILSLISHQQAWMVLTIFAPMAVLAGCGVYDLYLGTIKYDVGVRRLLGRVSPLGDMFAPVLAIVVVILSAAVFGAPGTVAGVTSSPEPKHQEEAYTEVRHQALQSGCNVTLGPDADLWPGMWWLRGIGVTHVDSWDDWRNDSVTINRGPIPVRGPSNHVTTVHDWRVYVPTEVCSDSG